MNRNIEILALVVGMGLSSSCDRKRDSAGEEPTQVQRTTEARSQEQRDDKLSKGNARRLPSRSREVEMERRNTLDGLVMEWNLISRENTGDSSLQKQREFAILAVNKLGAGPELLLFLDYLKERGVGDLRDWVLQEGLDGLFSGDCAREGREWVLSVGDENLKVRFLRVVGEEWAGVGFKNYYDSLDGDKAGQASLLVGYCAALAKTDALGAMGLFKEYCIAKRFNYAQLPEVIAMAPANSDFVKMAGFFDGDDRPLAKTSRRAVLLNWAGVKPEDAAQYVISNTKLVNPDQMAVVVEKWARTAPDAAANWLNQAPAGKPRDEGMTALAQHWTARGEPKSAWQCAAQVWDFDQRVAVATKVFKEWETKDHDAAVKAWEELFPPAK